MTMMKPQAIAIANFVRSIRPGWDFPGIMAALATHSQAAEPAVVAMAAIACAADDQAETPAAMANPVYWPAWLPGQALAAQQHARSEQTKTQRVVAEIQAEKARFDPDECHRGYLAAKEALTEARAR